MSDSHHHDPIEDNIDTHPVKLAIGVVIGAVTLIIGIILVAQYAIGSYGSRSLKDDPAMSPEAVAKRLAPVGRVVIDPKAPAPAPAAPAATLVAMPAVAIPAAAIPVASAKAASGAGAGKATYDVTCHVCHAAGIAGAPKFGDRAAWAPRIAAGKDRLYMDSIKGKGAMPPRGGNAALSDDAVKAAVDYMLAALK